MNNETSYSNGAQQVQRSLLTSNICTHVLSNAPAPTAVNELDGSAQDEYV